PESGIHVDALTKTLGVWVTNPIPGLLYWLPQLWPGWRTEFWEDRYEEQLRRCGSHITAPVLDINSGVGEAQSWLQKRVFQSFADSPAGRIGSLVALFDAEELPSPEVSAAAVFDTGDRPSSEEWARFERACARVRSSR